VREIKFRAWDKTNRRMLPVNDINWVEGNARYNIDFITVWDDELNTGYTLDTHDNDFELMQYTGLKDKNGKEIYEGDILNYPKHKGYYLIKWICDGAEEVSDCGFACERDKPSYNYMLPSVWKRMEVIGNVHQNPELLKGA